jgi:single-strand DNA-binding protein
MNIVALTGRLAADTNVKYTQSGKAVCTFDIAVDDGFGDNKQTYFHRIVVWGKAAESCGNNLSKGSKVNVKGKLTSRSYESNGQKKYITEVVADMYGGVEFLSSKKQGAPQAQEEPDENIQIPF